MPGTRKLGRASDHRKAMLRAMVTYLLENGKIETTLARAKEVRSMAEKMITLGKRDDLHAKRQVFSFITKENVAKKVIDEIGPKYTDRDGGYTRIVKPACAAAMLPKWPSLNWCKLPASSSEKEPLRHGGWLKISGVSAAFGPAHAKGTV